MHHFGLLEAKDAKLDNFVPLNISLPDYSIKCLLQSLPNKVAGRGSIRNYISEGAVFNDSKSELFCP